MKKKLKLFEVSCKADYNRNLTERVEYLRCSDINILRNAIFKAFSNKDSEYFGYTMIHVKEITVNSFPEIKQIILNKKPKTKTK